MRTNYRVNKRSRSCLFAVQLRLEARLDVARQEVGHRTTVVFQTRCPCIGGGSRYPLGRVRIGVEGLRRAAAACGGEAAVHRDVVRCAVRMPMVVLE